MPASLNHTDSNTPMGANLIADGATFKCWAPKAKSVHVIGDFNHEVLDDSSLLTRDHRGYWLGFLPGVKDRNRYMFYVEGVGGKGPKRDPYARELEKPFPSKCVVRDADFPWHQTGYVTPQFHNFVIYQLHVGTFFTPNAPNKGGTFLDVATKLPYFDELGISALQLLPIQEFQTNFSKGYNGTDLFSPEMDYAVDDDKLGPYTQQLNQMLAARGLAPYKTEDLRGEMNQLKALIDLCHVFGIAVLLDVVYNHAGGSFGNQSMYFFDWQQPGPGNGDHLYFSDVGHAGGLVFDFSKPEVCDFLIQNAKYFLTEYHVDGFRYDQVSVIDHDGAPHGWSFCQALTSTVKFHRPSSLHLAEYWNVNPYIVKRPNEGAGFDTTLTNGLRLAVRNVIGDASAPDSRPLNMTALGRSLWPEGFSEPWQFVQGPENHDIVFEGRDQRMAKLGDFSNSRSWYARSRARVATGISLTAPGIPMLFMGQEFLEDKQWSDNFIGRANLLLYWDGLTQGDKQMLDHLRFTRELIQLRWMLPALRSSGFRLIHAHDQNRVLAFHRWIPGGGQDVVVVVHLGNDSRFGYRVGFPSHGPWKEVFNSDVYESWVNPHAIGNAGQAFAEEISMHEFAYSANLVLPANSILVFAK